MNKRIAVVLAGALLGVACGHPEKNVVDSYFNAVNTGDTQTLSSFAAVTFDQKADRWQIKRTIKEDPATPFALPDLVQKAKDADAAVAANKKAASAWSLDNINNLEQVREARKKNQPVPPKLGDTAKKWDEFNDKDRELKKELANVNAAVEKEKRNAVRSVGQADDLESLKGDVLEKQIELDVTVKGVTKPYVMTLRKYDLKREGGGPRIISRWVIQNLQPMS
jgi:hypothetical protein